MSNIVWDHAVIKKIEEEGEQDEQLTEDHVNGVRLRKYNDRVKPPILKIGENDWKKLRQQFYLLRAGSPRGRTLSEAFSNRSRSNSPNTVVSANTNDSSGNHLPGTSSSSSSATHTLSPITEDPQNGTSQTQLSSTSQATVNGAAPQGVNQDPTVNSYANSTNTVSTSTSGPGSTTQTIVGPTSQTLLSQTTPSSSVNERPGRERQHNPQRFYLSPATTPVYGGIQI